MTAIRDFEDRYAPNWQEIARRAHQATKGRCCLCRRAQSQQVHHVRYRDWRGAIAGRERPGTDVFPVCLPCHERLHLSDAWVKDSRSPVLGNHQVKRWVKRLKRGYRRLSGALMDFWSIAALLGRALAGWMTFHIIGATIGFVGAILLLK